MAIKKGDIKLVRSEVMDDVPEGGGGPTATVVVDGASNAMFPDISEVDRAAGRVSARKTHVWVQSNDTDTLLGPNVIIAEPPSDPNVSITLFSTNDVFDRRTAAISRIESYLNRGAAYPGFLYGDPITGQAVISIYQRTGDLPAIGATLALTKRKGYSNEFTQYVRIIEARAQLRTFTDNQGDFTRYVLDLKLSDPLRADFQGFGVSRVDPSPEELALRTGVSDVVVADAAQYFGVSRMQLPAALNDFSVKVASIFSQLVPSAQIETGIADARTNQLFVGMQASGGQITRQLSTIFSPAQSIYVGGGIKPGTLSVVGGTVVLEDAGGRLILGGEQVGTVDYENGVLALQSAVYGTTGVNLSVTFQPAQAVQAVTQSQGIKITQSTRARSFVRTIEPPPLAGSLSLAYRVAEQWYVLRDQGDGKLRGADIAYGAGTISADTGTLSFTLGALPDVGSEIIVQWVQPDTAVQADELKLDNEGRFYWPINSDGLVSEVAGTKGFKPGQVGFTWVDQNGAQRSAQDDSQGRLTGDAKGSVSYAQGVALLSPNALPPVGTPITLNVETRTRANFSDSPVTAGRGNLGFSNIDPGSVSFYVAVETTIRYNGGEFVPGPTVQREVFDGRDGKLWLVTTLNGRGYFTNGGYGPEDSTPPVLCGSIDYATGDFELLQTIAFPRGHAANLPFLMFNNFPFNETRMTVSVLGDTLRS